MSRMLDLRWVGLFVGLTAAFGCGGGQQGGTDSGGNAGTPASGGATGSGSQPGSGGTDASGGSNSSGGSAAGGTSGTGGASVVDGCVMNPVAVNGKLSVCGRELCNQHGRPIQLRGMSTHGLQWYGLGNCVTAASLDALASEWCADLLRISLYVQEGGYETNPAAFRQQVDDIVDLVVARGMYALLDWHMLEPGDPWENLELAKEYFTYMTETHGSKPNILYEIANEPSGVTWDRIKSYAEELIPLIRQHDPDSVVIVGTRHWSSFGLSGDGSPTEVINSPVDFSNVMYSFHFYAASHLEYHRQGLAQAADALPVFVTEWGSQEYTGDGPNDFVSAQQYIDLMAQKKISWANWNYSDDMRSGAVFEQGTCANGPFTGDGLKEAGAWVQDKIKNPPDDFPTQ